MAFDVRTGANATGFSTRFPEPTSLATTRGSTTHGDTPATPACGARSASTSELGIVYLPTEIPTNDYYGGHRHGDNLFANSLVAVDIETGERIWHFQFIHHDVWDWDTPMRADSRRHHRRRPRDQGSCAADQTGLACTCSIEITGEPVWPIEERPVPPSDVPGELLSETQPFPTKPPAYERQGVSLDDLVDFTPEIRRRAASIASNYRIGPIFTPPSVSDADETLGTLVVPST